MSDLSKEQEAKLLSLLESTTKHVLGTCMFCASPIMKSALENSVVDFQLLVQRVSITLDDIKITKDVQGFLVCRNCRNDSHKLQVAKNLSKIDLDFGAVTKELQSAIEKRERERRIREAFENEGSENGKV